MGIFNIFERKDPPLKEEEKSWTQDYKNVPERKELYPFREEDKEPVTSINEPLGDKNDATEETHYGVWKRDPDERQKQKDQTEDITQEEKFKQRLDYERLIH